MTENPGGFAARVLGVVLLLSVALPIAFWTGKPWLLIFALVPVLGWGEIVRDAAWLALVTPRRGLILLSGWLFVLLGTVDGAAVVLVLWESSWVPAVVCGVLGGSITYLAVCRVVTRTWIAKNLYDYASPPTIPGGLTVGFPANRQPFGPIPSRTRARQLMDLQPPVFRSPSFRIYFRDLRNDIAELHLRVAAELRTAGALDEALLHCAEASALRRRITDESRRTDYLIAFAQALGDEVECLISAGRIAEAVRVGEEELGSGRRINAVFAHHSGFSAADKSRTLGYLGKSLERQADLLHRIGRTAEAEKLTAEARDLGLS
ncbi:hypothetical protein [Nocardia sp. NPDC003963]